MSRHAFRWDSLIFGLLFAAAVGSWAVLDQDLLTARQLSVVASATMILLGTLGVAATLIRPRLPEPTPTDISRGDPDEAADPQS